MKVMGHTMDVYVVMNIGQLSDKRARSWSGHCWMEYVRVEVRSYLKPARVSVYQLLLLPQVDQLLLQQPHLGFQLAASFCSGIDLVHEVHGLPFLRRGLCVRVHSQVLSRPLPS